MARGPDSSPESKTFGKGSSLADDLFNAGSVADLGAAFARLPGFDPDRFQSEAMAGLAERSLMQRIDWLADCLAPQLPDSFPAMADALEAALPPELDPTRRDDDFGRFIYAVFGVLAVKHGMDHPERALDLLHAATRRFSMEYAIRPFLNRWPEQTMARLAVWAEDDNYHVRRLVSEGTRPRLPWGQKITIDPLSTLPLLDRLHGDRTRFVTRSVANHLNDLTRSHPEAVTGRLSHWAQAPRDPKELDWLTRHALRGAVKRGDAGALALLGYRAEGLRARLRIDTPIVRIGEALRFTVTLEADAPQPVMVDYRLRFARPKGSGEKVFKLKKAQATPGAPLTLTKVHKLMGDATTYRLHPGPHAVTLQVNGQDMAEAAFELVSD